MAETKSLRERIEEYSAEHPNEHLRTLAEVLCVPEREIVANTDGAVSIPPTDFCAVWNEVSEWERTLFYVDHGNVIVEAEGKLPKGEIMFDGTMLNLCGHGEVTGNAFILGGHIYIKDLQAIYLVRKILYGKESLSIMFYDSGKGSMFGLFAGRNEKREIIPSVREGFEKLRTRYAVI
jgi:putative heme utilization carrier protein HutX